MVSGEAAEEIPQHHRLNRQTVRDRFTARPPSALTESPVLIKRLLVAFHPGMGGRGEAVTGPFLFSDARCVFSSRLSWIFMCRGLHNKRETSPSSRSPSAPSSVRLLSLPCAAASLRFLESLRDRQSCSGGAGEQLWGDRDSGRGITASSARGGRQELQGRERTGRPTA